MKHTTRKLVSVLCLTLLLAFSAILIVFHFTMSKHIEATAKQAIDYLAAEIDSLSLYDETEDDFEDEQSIIASCLLVDRNYSPPDYELTRRKAIANWCKLNPDIDGDIDQAKISNRQYYVMQLKNRTAMNDGSGIWLIYVDITSEEALIQRIDVTMLVIMALCALLASFFGIRVGVSIERGQERQKRFFENASHELKTPLMSIQGYAEGIYDGIITDQKHAVSVIMSETDKMTALVDEILCLSRIESGETKLNIESVAVRDVVNNCLVSLESVVIKKGLQIEAQLSDGIVQADAAQLETAVINLLTNAVKYAEKRIVINCDGQTLSVWNDGYGIPREECAHIFDRFYIGKNGSTGIGLALTKEIISRHGWKIGVEAYEGGTRFVIHFSKSAFRREDMGRNGI